MADKLSWLNQHPIWFMYPTVAQVVELNELNLSTQQNLFAQRFPLAEDFLKAMWNSGNFQDSCTFCAYNTVPRVAVWWAYSCVIDLCKELLLSANKDAASPATEEAKPVDISSIQPSSNLDPEAATLFNENLSKLQQSKAQLMQCKAILNNSPAGELASFVDSAIARVFFDLKINRGVDIDGTLQECFQLLKKLNQTPANELDEIQLAREAEELQAKVDNMQVNAQEMFSFASPNEDIEKITKLKAQCLDAVWAYIVSPNENTAQVLLNLGNSCKTQPEGLLALVAFWSYGSLTPNESMVIKTPVGLMANGIDALVSKCAVFPGGIYKPAERYERYFNAAFSALINESTWDPYVERNTSPHKELQREVAEAMLSHMTKAQTQPQTQPVSPQSDQANTSYAASLTPSDSAASISCAAFNATAAATMSAPAAVPSAQSQAASNPPVGSGSQTNAETRKSWDEIFAERKAAAPTPDQAAANQPPSAAAQAGALPQNLAGTSAQAGAAPETQSMQVAPEVQAQKQAAEQALQERLATVRPDINRRFRG